MLRRWLAWSWALIVMLITAALVVLDLSDGPIHRYWSQHAFASSVLSGLLVLLLTVLIVDRVTRMRQLRNQSRAIAAQAAIIVAQAARTVDAITAAPPSEEEGREVATDELRTYTQMLLISAPVLIDAAVPRAFLETAQRLAGQMFRAVRDGGDETATKQHLDDGVARLRSAAAPLLAVLNRAQREAVSSDESAPSG